MKRVKEYIETYGVDASFAEELVKNEDKVINRINKMYKNYKDFLMKKVVDRGNRIM